MTKTAQDDVATNIVNVLPAAPAPPGHAAPKNSHGLIEHGTAHGWERRPAMVARAIVTTKRKAPPEEEGKAYSMQPVENEVEQYVAYLVKGKAILVLIWLDGKFEAAICNRPLRKLNFTEVRKFIKGEL